VLPAGSNARVHPLRPLAIILGLVLLLTAPGLAIGPAPSGALAPSPGADAASTGAGPSLVHHAALPPSHGTSPLPAHSQPNGRQPLVGSLARFPHPQPSLVGAHPASYYGHYYAGTYYTDVNTSSTQLSATINVPLDVASSNDFYYVLLSVWDNAGSYDQVGFANAAGDFGVAYSTTDYCANNYYYSPDAMSLPRGVTYNFSMTLSQGAVVFNVTASNGTRVFTLSQVTGGTAFIDSAFYTCYSTYYGGNITAYDYTDYEEVYQTYTDVPPYDFFFGENVANTTPITGFSVFTTPPLPGNITVLINGDNAVVANTPYELALHAGTGMYVLESSPVNKSFILQLEVDPVVSPSSAVNISITNVPAGWPVGLSATHGTPRFTFTSSITVPANTSAGNYTIGYSVADGSGLGNQLSAFFWVVPKLVVSVVLGPHSVADLGQNITLSAKIGGGLGGLAFAWTGLPTGCGGTSQTLSCTPTESGAFVVTVSATDSGGDVAVSNPFTLHIYPAPIVSATALPNVVDVNHSIQLFAAGSGGANGFTYTWTALPPGCHGSGATVSCTPTVVGTFYPIAWAVDLVGYHVNSTPATVQVVPAPAVSVLSTPTHADVGQPVTISATGLGGIGNLTFAWTGLGAGCAASGPRVQCAFQTPGAYTVTVVATDDSHVDSPAAQVFVQVSTAPQIQFRPQSASLDLGQAITFAAQVTGGAPAYTYSYTGLPAGCTSVSSSGLVCRPTAPGVYPNVTVAVTDLNDWTVFAVTNLTVYPAPSAQLSVRPTSLAQGDSVILTASDLGGSGGDVYAWNDLPGGCTPAPSATITCVPDGEGTYHISVQVTDTNGMSSNATATLVVGPPPALVSNDVTLYLGLGVVAVVAVVAGLLLLRRARARRAAEAPAEEDTPAAP
jgi:hypothetical protein